MGPKRTIRHAAAADEHAVATERVQYAEQLALIARPATPTRADLEREVERLRARSVPANTRKTYAVAWKDFLGFCAEHRYTAVPAPPRAVAAYLSHLHQLGKPLRRLKLHKAAIRRYHLDRNHADPGRDRLVRETWKGIIAEIDDATLRPTHAAARDALIAIVDRIDQELREAGRLPSANVRLGCLRDRALVLLAYSSAHPSAGEIRLLRIEDIVQGDRGVEMTLRRSEEPQWRSSEPRLVRYGAAPYCPVAALQEWIRQLGREKGPIAVGIDRHGHLGTQGISGKSLRKMLERRCAQAGYTKDLLTFRGLRAGAMFMRAYEGDQDEAIVDDAGLSEQSAVLLRQRFDQARKLRKDGRPPAETFPLK